jgi:predicted TIM-barrel fold metal-dependent hydrolase
MWSSDYPHPVSTWPKSESIVAELFADTPPEDRDLMVSGNARRIWSL